MKGVEQYKLNRSGVAVESEKSSDSLSHTPIISIQKW